MFCNCPSNCTKCTWLQETSSILFALQTFARVICADGSIYRSDFVRTRRWTFALHSIRGARSAGVFRPDKSRCKKGRLLRDVARCFKMFQETERFLGVLMSMPETSRDILRCYSLLWPRPGGRKAEGLQADLLYAWCAA